MGNSALMASACCCPRGHSVGMATCSRASAPLVTNCCRALGASCSSGTRRLSRCRAISGGVVGATSTSSGAVRLQLRMTALIAVFVLDFRSACVRGQGAAQKSRQGGPPLAKSSASRAPYCWYRWYCSYTQGHKLHCCWLLMIATLKRHPCLLQAQPHL